LFTTECAKRITIIVTINKIIIAPTLSQGSCAGTIGATTNENRVDTNQHNINEPTETTCEIIPDNNPRIKNKTKTTNKTKSNKYNITNSKIKKSQSFTQ
jgi:hypothetical protein